MTVDIRCEEQIALGQLRALVMADADLQATLGEADNADRFLELALGIAAGRGLPLAAGPLRAALHPDPLGLARWTAAPVAGSMRPPPPWLPIHIAADNGRLCIDWAYFGASPLTEPFFEGSIRRIMARPFNRVFRYRMTLDDFFATSAAETALAPSGFIFHMSRCGSTLVAQMLAALPGNLVISEAAPIDAVVQLVRSWPELPADRQVQTLTAMIAAFGRRRTGVARHYVVKLDFWHALALPLFRRAYPAVPWVFLYRDPVEVLVSQMHETGPQLIAGMTPPSRYGLDGGDADDDYAARVIAKVCAAAADGISEGGGLAVNYRALPNAVFTTILPHFGIECSAREREIMSLAARRDAKAAALFAGDSAAKQREASPRIRALAQRHLAGVYSRLESSRAA